MSDMSCVVGLDMGTTSVKAVAFDADGHEITRASAAVETQHDDSGAAEQDPAQVYNGLTESLAHVATEVQKAGYRVERVGLSGAMHSLIPVAEDGTPLYPAILWMDTRASQEAAELWASAEGPQVYERTGTPVHAMAPLVKLIWLRRQLPDLFAGAARFVSLKEWVWRRWFGQWQIDASIASATGLYNLRSGTWDEGALRLAGIGAERLSAIVPTTYTRPAADSNVLVGSGAVPETVCNIGASDGVLANLGVGAITSDLLVMTIGTSLAVRTGSTATVVDPTTRPFCYVLDTGRYIIGGPSNNGGVVLDWLFRKVLGGPKVNVEGEPLPPGFVDLLNDARDARHEDLLCLPYVAGERAPLWNADVKGVVYGLQVHHGAADVMRAAVEGIILNAYWIASRIFERQGLPREVVASGKVLETDWIRQVVADVFGIPVRFLGNIDASATGAAALANIATGIWTWDETVQRLRASHGTVTQPQDHEAYQAKYQLYRRLSDAVLPLMSGR
jgi:gluconokinase